MCRAHIYYSAKAAYYSNRQYIPAVEPIDRNDAAYVTAGQVEADGQLRGSFVWVAKSADDARRFIRSTLLTHGWTPKSRVVVLANGADGLTGLVRRATENSAQPILDWFHISMRLRAIEQVVAKTAAVVEAINPILAGMIRQKLTRVRYQM